VLALAEVFVLFGLQDDLAGLLPEHLEGLTVGHREKLARRAGGRGLGLGDLCRLVQGDRASLEGVADLIGVLEGLARLHRRLRFTHREAANARHLGSIVELARQHRLAVGRELFGAGVTGEQLIGFIGIQQLGLEICVGFLEAADRFADRSAFHNFILTEGCDRNSSSSARACSFFNFLWRRQVQSENAHADVTDCKGRSCPLRHTRIY
jgi:hypothetical protein